MYVNKWNYFINQGKILEFLWWRLHGYFADPDPTLCSSFYFCVDGTPNKLTCPRSHDDVDDNDIDDKYYGHDENDEDDNMVMIFIIPSWW